MTHNRFYMVALFMALSGSMSSMWAMDITKQSPKQGMHNKDVLKNKHTYPTQFNGATARLLDACCKTDKSLGQVKKSIEDGAYVNFEPTEDVRSTPFVYSAMYGNVRIMEFLDEKGADINARTFCGSHGLHLAARYGHIEGIRFFIKKNVDLNMKSGETGATPFHLAALGGHIKTLEFLEENNANPNSLTNDQATPLYYAMANKQFDIARILLQRFKADPTVSYQTGATALHAAAFGNAPKWMFEELINAKADINAKTKKNQATPLHVAVSKPLSLPIIRLLLEKGADPYATDVDDRKPLFFAVDKGYTDIVKLLAEHFSVDAPVAACSKTALHIACENGDVDMVKFLMDLGVQHTLAEGKYLPIDYANKNGYFKIVTLINQYLNADKIAKELALEEDTKNASSQQVLGKNRKNNLKKKAKKQEKKAALLKASGVVEVAPLIVPQENSSSSEEVVVAVPTDESFVLKKEQIVLDTPGNNNFGSLKYGQTRKMFVYPDHKRVLPFGTYFKGADEVSFIPSGTQIDNIGSQAAVNHLENVVYSKHVLSKMIPKDAHHNFPTTFEKQFGHLSCAVLTDTRITEQRKAYLKKQYEISENIDDFWLEFVIEIPATIGSADFPEKKAIAQEPQGVVEIRGLKKDLADGNMLVVHRFYRKNK